MSDCFTEFTLNTFASLGVDSMNVFAMTVMQSYPVNYDNGGIGMRIKDIKFDEKGYVPVIVQDVENGQILMFAYANQEAIKETIKTKKTHFWSRSRNRLWAKGEESGNAQEVRDVFLDCDKDAILVLVNQTGVACHTGKRSCFFETVDGNNQIAPSFGPIRTDKTLEDVYQVIEDRKRNPRENSYVSGLFKDGLDKILKKVGEEATETIIAGKNVSKQEVIYEMTDLLFHSLVMLAQFEIKLEDIYEELGKRFGKSKESYRRGL